MPELKTYVTPQEKAAFKLYAVQHGLTEYRLLHQIVTAFLANKKDFKPIYRVKILQVNR